MAGLILILVGMFRPLAGGKRRLPERGSAMYISYFESGRNTSETCRSSAVTCCVKTGGGSMVLSGTIHIWTRSYRFCLTELPA